MSESYDLHQIRRRTIQLTTFEDGLWDILLGITFMSLAISWITLVCALVSVKGNIPENPSINPPSILCAMPFLKVMLRRRRTMEI